MRRLEGILDECSCSSAGPLNVRAIDVCRNTSDSAQSSLGVFEG